MTHHQNFRLGSRPGDAILLPLRIAYCTFRSLGCRQTCQALSHHCNRGVIVNDTLSVGQLIPGSTAILCIVLVCSRLCAQGFVLTNPLTGP